MVSTLTVRELLAEGMQRLSSPQSLASESAALDAELLLAHVLHADRSRLRAWPDAACEAHAASCYRELVERRAAGEPAAYLVGWRDFWTLRLAVTPAVLVPRPETELLVERALALALADDARVADLGTGSGAIALALASERPRWRVTATDRSDAALGVARANAEALGLARVELAQGDWFGPLAGRRFDLVLSNPPYVEDDEPALANGRLGFEPRGALAAGAAGLDCLRAIVAHAPDHLDRGGWLMLEHGARQADAVAHELVARGFTHVRSLADLAGHPRMTEARWP